MHLIHDPTTGRRETLPVDRLGHGSPRRWNSARLRRSLRLPLLLTAAVAGLAASVRAGAPALSTVREGERDLPVVVEADVVVAGGGVAGVAAALRAAEAGLSVVLLESRNYFGQELTATEQCRTTAGIPPASAPLARALSEELAQKGIVDGERLDPRGLRALLVEKIKAQPRITPLFFALPTDVVIAEGRVQGVVFASRDGRHVALARVVVDATEDARLAAAAGAPFARTWQGTNTARRFIAIKPTPAMAPGIRPVPARFGLQGNQVTIHRGSIELTVDASIGPDFAAGLAAQQAITLAHSFALRKHWQAEGVVLPDFTPAAEVWFDATPVVTCREPLRTEEIARLEFTRPAAVQPLGVEGLFVAGRTLAADPRLGGVAALLAAGELAGRAAAPGAPVDARRLAPSTPPRPDDPDAPRIAELLEGFEPDRVYPRVRLPARDLPVRGHYDVVVVGGGTAGAIAAIAAARHGARVAVLEILPNLGGISSNRVNTYYWGNPAKSLLRQELGERIDLQKKPGPGQLEKVPFSGEDKKHALQELAQVAGVSIHYQTLGTGAVVQGTRVHGVVAESAAGRQVFLAKVVIDSTGRAGVAIAAGAGYAKGRSTDGFLHEIEHGPLRDPTHLGDISRSYLQRQSYAPSMNIRESRRVIGDYIVTFDDALHERIFPDIVCRWRSNYDTHFPNSANQSDLAQDWVAILGQWRRPLSGTIPYRSLLPKGLDGILVAAMAYSTDHDTLIAARMQQDMEHLGEAAGIAAAMAGRLGITPRELPIAELQAELIRRGVLVPEDVPGVTVRDAPAREVLHRQDFWRPEREKQFPPSAAARPVSLEARVAQLGTEQALEAMVQLYLAGERAIPLLRPLLGADRIPAREEAALLLGLLGDRRAVPALLELLRTRNPRRLEYKLPLATSRPSVPFFWSAAILLGRFGEKSAVPLLQGLLAETSPTHPSFASGALARREASQLGGSGASLASFTIAALGRIGDPQAAPVIRPFLQVARPVGISDENADFELAWGVRTNAAVALASLGDRSGLPVLIDLLAADQALLRQYARKLLEAITGQRFGTDPGAWRQWLQHAGTGAPSRSP